MSDLTQRVRAKYPGVYDDLSDADLEKAVLAKHPEYADLASKQATPAATPFKMPAQPSTAGMLRNAGKDVVDTLGGLPDALAQVVSHPIDSLTAIPVGMMQNIVKLAKDPLGTMYEHPANTALDIAGADAAVRGVSGLAGVPSKIRGARMMAKVDRYMPNRSTADWANPVSADNTAEALSTGVDRFMPNTGAASHAGDPDAVATARVPASVIDRYLPNSSAASHAGDPNAVATARVPASVIDRYMANSGAASHAGDPGAVATARVPASVIDRYLPNQSSYQAGQAPAIALQQPTLAESAQQAAGASASSAAAPRPPVSRPDLAAPAPTEIPRSWHAFLNNDAREAASGAERQGASALHREVAQMDADYRRRIADDRGSVPIGVFMNPGVVKEGAKMALEKLAQQVPSWMPSPATAARGVRDTALLSREAKPQPNALQSLVDALMGR